MSAETMIPAETVIETIEDEVDDDFSNDDLYNITSYGADLSFRELISMYEESELAKPEMQRNYVWDKSEASRFIESLLLSLPVPSIFLAKSSDETKLIVDGYQRIMTVYDYVHKGVFSGDGKTFKLANSKKINSRWRNKAFNELTDAEQRRIKSTTIHAIIFEQKEPKNDSSMYQVFERINTSGRTLLPQEIRNCIYQGGLNTLLFEINKFENWRILFGERTPDTRMRDMEFILRYFALQKDYLAKAKSEQISFKLHLNEYMKDHRNPDNAFKEAARKDFQSAINLIHEKIGPDAFHNLSAKDHETFTDKFHPTIFDALMISAHHAISTSTEVPEDIKERRIKLLRDEEFKNAIRIRTSRVDRIKLRIQLASKFLFDLKYE